MTLSADFPGARAQPREFSKAPTRLNAVRVMRTGSHLVGFTSTGRLAQG